MKLSIVIPTLNEASEVGECVASARSAAGGGLPIAEVVVADGGSTDGTASRAAAAGATVITAQRGRGRQLRAGVAATSGDVVLMLHADNRLPESAGDQIADALAGGAQVGFFRQRVDAPDWVYRWIERGNALRGRWLRLPYGDQAIFMRRALLDRAGGVPPLPLMEDVALMQRTRKSARPVMLPGPLLVSARRWRRCGIVRQTLRNWSLLAAFTLGVPARKLAPRYASHDRAEVEPIGVTRPSASP